MKLTLVHSCNSGTQEWFDSIDDYDNAYGSLVNSIKGVIVKRVRSRPDYPDDPCWMLEVNGGEYRGPIRFCPFCGENPETRS